MTDQNRLLQLAQGAAGGTVGAAMPQGMFPPQPQTQVFGNPVADYYGQVASQQDQLQAMYSIPMGIATGMALGGVAPAIPVAGLSLGLGAGAQHNMNEAQALQHNFERFPAAPFSAPLPTPNIARNDGR